jgi:hypothetical protein
MAPRESEPQKETVERVLHEFKHGELRCGTGGQKVKSRRQASSCAAPVKRLAARGSPFAALCENFLPGRG